MKNNFNAITNSNDKDQDFLINIIAQICDYAINNNMRPTKTLTDIANNILMLTSISNFDNWERRKKENDGKRIIF